MIYPITNLLDYMSLRLPFVVWTGIPSHEITSIASSKDGDVVVTGSSTGACCKWIRDPIGSDEGNLLPQMLFVPSSCSPSISVVIVTCEETELIISCLFFFTFFIFISDHFLVILFISVQENQDIYTWDMSDGSCISSFTFPGGGLTKLAFLTNQYIALIGNFNSFHIFNPLSMTLQYTCVGHNNWVRDVKTIKICGTKCL